MTEPAQESTSAIEPAHEGNLVPKAWTIWLACSAAIAGSFVVGLFLLPVLWIAPILGALYAIFAAFTVPRIRRRALEQVPNPSLEAAQFHSPPQVMTLLTNSLLLLTGLFAGFEFVLFVGNNVGWSWVEADWARATSDLTLTLIFCCALPLSALALCFGITYHRSKTLVAGEQLALTNKTHAHHLIRAVRILNWVVMYFYLLGGIAWLVLLGVSD